jgi:hypothetical protein
MLQQLCLAIYTAMIAVIFFASHILAIKQPIPIPMHTSILTGLTWLDQVLHGHPGHCHREFGMSALQFALLWAELAATGDLSDSRYITMQEQLRIFYQKISRGG